MSAATLSSSSSSTVGFWGPTTSTIDWCEPNYAVSHYIAEFWNTWSNLFFVLLGLYGLVRSIAQGFELRFHLIYLNVMVVGIGSAMFHGTLTYVSQQCDETPMIWSTLLWFYILYSPLWESCPTWIDHMIVTSLVVVGASFAILHSIYRFTTAFQLLFSTLVVLCLPRLLYYYSHTTDARARALVVTYLVCIVLAAACWLVDYHQCHAPYNVYGHAWWHCFMSMNAYAGPLFMQFVRAVSKGQRPHVVHTSCPLVLTIDIRDEELNKTE
ncbi:Aste57867_9638 [Aphanomyces stellatus]|uniref:Aste57867_9638 protein n=1 Tax=Aphanomyces stellatus TaxID=120398 RepID=A0A485KNY0_9STRA|nr:hypothetical protein As57867_009600 [Aphanomyces stellatus]VFT86517.1 Aste57867_9638 [Aphanomyces stellatus]